MAQAILPFLSGSLESVIEEMTKKGDPIAQHILQINKLVNDVLSLYSFMPDSLKQAILNKVIRPELTDEVSMLSYRAGSNEPNISFLPKGKEPEYSANGTWARRNRQEGKPAKIFQKALVKEFKQVDWELFTNTFKAEVCQCNNFELVSGEDIRKWYWDQNYYDCSGTLGNSCMRYDGAQEFFDIYVENAKMLITKKAGKLTGRAIVWEIDENTVLLDRIYTCFDYLTNCFIDYAKEHGWWIRENNSLLHTGEQQHWLTPADNYTHPVFKPFTIKLKSHYELFPYVDSFRYYNPGSNEISTVIGDAALDSTDGDYSGCSRTCDNCGHVFYRYTDDDDLPEEMHWSEWGDCYVCDNCSYWCEYLEDYIPDSVDHVNIINELRYNGYDMLPAELVGEHLCANPDEAENEEDYPIIKIGDKYYDYMALRTHFVFNLDTNSYEIRSTSNERDWGSPQGTQSQINTISTGPVEAWLTVDGGTFSA